MYAINDVCFSKVHLFDKIQVNWYKVLLMLKATILMDANSDEHYVATNIRNARHKQNKLTQARKTS